MANEAMQAALLAALKTGMKGSRLYPGALMSRYTTLRLGGEADVLASVSSPEEIALCFAAAKAVGAPVYVVGNGSNLLVADRGLRGLVIHLGEDFSGITPPVPQPDGSVLLTAQAGATLQKLCNAAAENALAGLEFAGGIPGTVGGAVYMNAGAYGGEMKDVVSSVTLCARDGRVYTVSGPEMDFGYRHSRLMEEDAVVCAATVRLFPGPEDVIRTAMREFAARRREKQPMSLPSCGSTFKRPQGHFAGALIEQRGLKGLRVGGCCVNEMHAGFLVNDEEGTAADYLALIRTVRERVLAETGVALEPEVRLLGFEEGETDW